MLSDEMDNPYRAPTTELPAPPVAADPVSYPNTLGWSVLTLYLRLVGGLQLLYGLLFGWIAFGHMAAAIDSGLNLVKYHVLFSAVMGPISAVLALASFFAGASTLRLRRSCRRWQLIYLGTYLGFLVAAAVLEGVKRAQSLVNVVSMAVISVPAVLPFLPVVLLRHWPTSSIRRAQ